MRDLLLIFPTPVLVLLIVGGSALLAVAGTYWVRRRFEEKAHQANNEVAGFIFSAMGATYGVLLAFMVLVVWQTFEDAHVTVEHEANALVNIFRLGQELPEPYATQVQSYSIEYAQSVINDEWTAMAYTRESESVRQVIEKLWAAHRQLHVDASETESRQERFFNALETLVNFRRVRLLESRFELPTLMWLLLISGGIVTIGFTLFLRAPNYKAHLLMAGMFAGLVAFVLLLIIELDNPFAGAVKIEPLAFQQALQLFERLRGK